MIEILTKFTLINCSYFQDLIILLPLKSGTSYNLIFYTKLSCLILKDVMFPCFQPEQLEQFHETSQL